MSPKTFQQEQAYISYWQDVCLFYAKLQPIYVPLKSLLSQTAPNVHQLSAFALRLRPFVQLRAFTVHNYIICGKCLEMEKGSFAHIGCFF